MSESRKFQVTKELTINLNNPQKTDSGQTLIKKCALKPFELHEIKRHQTRIAIGPEIQMSIFVSSTEFAETNVKVQA